MKIFYKTNIIDCLMDKTFDAVCVPTNGFLKQPKTKGHLETAVMGAGLAKDFRDFMTIHGIGVCKNLELRLGKQLKRHGNITQNISYYENVSIVAFPTKKQFGVISEDIMTPYYKGQHKSAKDGDKFPGWMFNSDIKLIVDSAVRLKKLADEHDWKKIAIPKVGCGYGGLDWNGVLKPMLEKIFDDDRFIIVIDPPRTKFKRSFTHKKGFGKTFSKKPKLEKTKDIKCSKCKRQNKYTWFYSNESKFVRILCLMCFHTEKVNSDMVIKYGLPDNRHIQHMDFNKFPKAGILMIPNKLRKQLINDCVKLEIKADSFNINGFNVELRSVYK